MDNAKEISKQEFLDKIDMSPILDEDESPEEWIQSTGNDIKFYSSNWGIKPVFYVGNKGFEFIFLL